MELYKDYYPIDLKGETVMLCEGISFGWIGISVNFKFPRNENEDTIIIVNYKDGMSTKRMLARNDLIPIEIPLNIM